MHDEECRELLKKKEIKTKTKVGGKFLIMFLTRAFIDYCTTAQLDYNVECWRRRRIHTTYGETVNFVMDLNTIFRLNVPAKIVVRVRGCASFIQYEWLLLLRSTCNRKGESHHVFCSKPFNFCTLWNLRGKIFGWAICHCSCEKRLEI